MDIYETENSRYEIDTVAGRYRRTLIKSQPVYSPRLAYGEWLPLKDTPAPVNVMDDPFDHHHAPEARRKVLHIMHESSTEGIMTSPITFMAMDIEVTE